MASTPSFQEIMTSLDADNVPRGEIKKLAKQIKRDHSLAERLWQSGQFFPRMLAALIFDTKQLDEAYIDALAKGMADNEESERIQIADWLLANQLMKSAKTKKLLLTWQDSPHPILQRLFWYHQARLRWTGQTPPKNSADLVAAIEKGIMQAVPEVQWAMNFCAAQIGIHQQTLRSRCIAIGEQTGLYRDEKVPANCTSNYLPEFIRIEVAKREGE